ncbi:sensor histidine kinase [Thioflexithrix psekupsensis]|uniref:histidine kinase n=1 Tax=Thioflexithrix psekupsensis TaxID=1570016 RepID=A0A251XC29_9GAMM|nr:sensor histidine kinase [Thioflexithrix psekupsensis]OUD15707.1 histidine kinase [Thioflexithrix psekupsensis]
MLQHWVILLVSLGYLGLLFWIAYYADKRADQGRSLISNPYVYTLSLAIYCTAWTFYGSVGRADSSGVDFLPIYLGPTLMAALFWIVLRKIIRIAKIHRITSIADFIGSRYGKSTLLGGLVTVIAVIGILPYVALQLKAVSNSFEVIYHYPQLSSVIDVSGYSPPFWTDTAFYVALLLAAFTILFGTRHIDATERHEGMVAAIAFESLVKLIAFLAVGFFVTFMLFDGPADLFRQAAEKEELERLMGLDSLNGGLTHWFSLIFLAMMAIMFLPRQFQVNVVENVNEEHVKTASWLFPMYLLAINFFVLPIAMGGHLLFADSRVDPDTFVLTVPMMQQAESLALLVFIGGLSAATSMVIVETIALSTMVCNDLVMPVLLRIKSLKLTEREDLSGLLLIIRRITIVMILLMGYIYFSIIGESYALVTIGLVSFAAAAQFAPAILLGIYWKDASHKGAMVGLIGGFLIWAYTLLLPALAKSGWLDEAFIHDGLFGIGLLKPYALFGLEGLDEISHAVFWSMLFNVGGLVGVSLLSRQSTLERLQAVLFVDVFRTSKREGQSYYWGGSITIEELRALLVRFLGETRAQQAFEHYASIRNVDSSEMTTDPQLITFAERLLAGAIGSASAHVMVASIIKGQTLSVEGVMRILDETSQVLEYSYQLEEKSRELEAATAELRAANERLKELDRLKDEFVATVSHELRTPLTSIRAFSEILLNNPDMERQQQQEFLEIVVKEAERLTRLINEVLDLAKIESGRMEWHLDEHDLGTLIIDACNAVSQLFRERDIELVQELTVRPVVAFVDQDRFIQVIINLLSNACKFSEPQEGKVTVRLLLMDEHVRIEIKDNGSGLSPENLTSVFDKFYQVEDQQMGKPKGTGLGLPICQGIIEHHHGKIWAESELGQGATFIITLPKKQPDSTPQNE